jgi:hypothetical protein
VTSVNYYFPSATIKIPVTFFSLGSGFLFSGSSSLDPPLRVLLSGVLSGSSPRVSSLGLLLWFPFEESVPIKSIVSSWQGVHLAPAPAGGSGPLIKEAKPPCPLPEAGAGANRRIAPSFRFSGVPGLWPRARTCLTRRSRKPFCLRESSFMVFCPSQDFCLYSPCSSWTALIGSWERSARG